MEEDNPSGVDGVSGGAAKDIEPRIWRSRQTVAHHVAAVVGLPVDEAERLVDAIALIIREQAMASAEPQLAALVDQVENNVPSTVSRLAVLGVVEVIACFVRENDCP